MERRIPISGLRYVRIPQERITFRVSAPAGVTWEYQQPSGEQQPAVVDFTDALAPCVVCGGDAYLDLGPYWCVVRYRCGHTPAGDSEDDDGDNQDQR